MNRAVKIRSPHGGVGWLPIIDGHVLVGGAIPFTGYGTLEEALEATKKFGAGDPLHSAKTSMPISEKRALKIIKLVVEQAEAIRQDSFDQVSCEKIGAGCEWPECECLRKRGTS